jgi:hypothetical protein
MALDTVQRLRGEMKEKLAYDFEEARKRKALREREEALDEYERVRRDNPFKPVYACVALLRCPWYACGFHFIVARFVTQEMGENIHYLCPKCQECFLSLRDAVRTFGTNTYPVHYVQKWMNKKPSYYLMWTNVLREAYKVYENLARKKALQGGGKRVSELTFGEGGRRPVTLTTEGQTMDQAIEEMRHSGDWSTTRSNPLFHLSKDDVEDFMVDPDAASRW